MTEFSRHPNQREYAIRLLSAFSEDLEPETSSKNILYIEGAALPAYEPKTWIQRVKELYEGSDIQKAIKGALPSARPVTKDQSLAMIADIEHALNERNRQVHILPTRNIKRFDTHRLTYHDEHGTHTLDFEFGVNDKGLFFLPSEMEREIQVMTPYGEKTFIVGKVMKNVTGLTIIPESILDHPFEALMYTAHELGHGEEARHPRTFQMISGETINGVTPYSEVISTTTAIGAGLDWADRYGMRSTEIGDLVYQIALYNRVLNIR
jgi:hypothetical protein